MFLRALHIANLPKYECGLRDAYSIHIASQGPVEGFQMEDEKSIWWLFCHTDNGSKSLWLYTTYSLYHQSSDATTSFNASLLTTYQWKSGCPVDVRHRCHIRLFGSTNLVDLMTSGIGKYTLCVLHTPVVMPLKPAKAPCTCKVYRTIDGQAWKYSILSWAREATRRNDVLQHSDPVRCTGWHQMHWHALHGACTWDRYT